MLLLAAACGRARAGDLDTKAAAKLFTLVPVDTDPGLSDLAVDDQGAIWTESERGLSVYRIVLDGVKVKSRVRYTVTGAPGGVDLEAVAWLGPGKLAFGTESGLDATAQMLVADIDERTHQVHVTKAIDLPKDRLGLTVAPNDGVEGLCGKGDLAIAVIESTAKDERGRWAPLVRIDLAHGSFEVARVALTSDKGKLSAVSCAIADDGSAQLLLIERHFGVSRFLRASLPPPGKAPSPPERVTPTVALDLTKVLNDSLNLEGIATLPDHRVVAVVDNDYGGITGPEELLVFKAGAVP